MITLSYTYKFIHDVPAMFPATQALKVLAMDPYDALHAFYLLRTLYSKRQSAPKGKSGSKNFDIKSSSIRLKDSANNFRASEPRGVSKLADTAPSGTQ